MLSHGTSLLSGYPWCLWGKPTGSGNGAATLDPNVGPPGTKRLEGMEPDQPEDPFHSLGQMLARIEEMRRAQAEVNRLVTSLWPSPVGFPPKHQGYCVSQGDGELGLTGVGGRETGADRAPGIRSRRRVTGNQGRPSADGPRETGVVGSSAGSWTSGFCSSAGSWTSGIRTSDGSKVGTSDGSWGSGASLQVANISLKTSLYILKHLVWSLINGGGRASSPALWFSSCSDGELAREIDY
ncbi:hypothetical protein EYF80_025876 [Liparis tanakae]|uniref:Uncharacterized protein n=1 Tax=Liparis tanakae TaxID=230148 RepID=A0A4Z2HGC0_9TELE|nr:hypothetical protein EYF80_025876 [Liparis tanakae]